MACVTATEVKEIMDGCTLTDAQVEPYISVAHTFITEVFATDTATSAAVKKELERWYAAHLIASIWDRITSKEKIGEAEVTYAVKAGSGFSSTPYGEMLLQLDVTGKIALAGKKAASIYAVKSFEN
jgi:hypothetical protein